MKTCDLNNGVEMNVTSIMGFWGREIFHQTCKGTSIRHGSRDVRQVLAYLYLELKQEARCRIKNLMSEA